MDDLNGQPHAGCKADEARQIGERAQTVGAGILIERDHLLPLAVEGFELAEESFPIVDGKGCAKVRTNWYSTPLPAGTRARVRVLPAHVEIWSAGKPVARHERCYSPRQQILDLEHYLDVLEHKPGALAGSKPLQRWRAEGRWPASFDALWTHLNERHGRPGGTRLMIELLQTGRRWGFARLTRAIEAAVALGATDAAVVHYLLHEEALAPPQSLPLDVGDLARYQRPPPALAVYDQLLSAAAS